MFVKSTNNKGAAMNTTTQSVWQQAKEGRPEMGVIRHTLVGTSFSILAMGQVHVDSYGAHGRARLSGKRSYVVYDGDRSIRYCDLLKDAKHICERRAS